MEVAARITGRGLKPIAAASEHEWRNWRRLIAMVQGSAVGKPRMIADTPLLSEMYSRWKRMPPSTEADRSTFRQET
jgi:hypothetical protein